MKKYTGIFLPLLLLASVCPANDRVRDPFPPGERRITLQKMWAEFDVTENGKPGIRVHAAVTLFNMKGEEGILGIYFKYSDGEPDSFIKHPDIVNSYHTTNGTLCVNQVLIPVSDAAVLDDVELFLPYDEFRLDPGEYDITIDMRFYHKPTKTWLSFQKLYDIVYTVPEDSRSAVRPQHRAARKPLVTSGPRAVLDSLWVERDVTEQNQLGMRLHFKFVTYQMKDTAASVAVYFLYNKQELEPLKDRNNNFATASGNVAAYLDINPGFDTAYYNNLTLFMPYNELHLAPGNYELLMDTKLIYRRGGLIANFLFYGFRYRQQ